MCIRDRGFDAQDLRLAIDIDFDSRTIEASARHRFLATAPLDTLVLDLTDSLAVDAVLRSDRPLAFSHAGGLLSIALAPPLSPGDTGSVTVLYHGRPPRTALLGFAFETRDDGSPGAYTLSEPDGASSWWPCKDVPSDKMTATIDLTVPDTLWAGSNGRLVSDEVAAGRRRQVWRESHPIAPYLVSIACTNYARFGGTFVSQDGIEMPLLFLAWPEDSADAAASWGRTAAMLAAFEDRFGPYPFLSEKYGMAEFSWGGAMEHQTLSSMGAYSIDGTDGNDWIVAHEMAHQWWGDDVTCADFDHIWLNEGFARYAEAIWFESQGGIEAYRDWMRRMWRPSFPGAIVPPDYLFNSTVYLKGAWVLHMLRGILGDEAFFDVLSLYRSRHSGGAATTEDLIRAAETVAGRSLRWFFDPWIYGTGRPAYLTSWTTDPGPEGTAIELTIEQTQPEPPFRMPIEVEIEDALGSYRVRVDDSLRVQTFRIAIRMPVEGTRLDPDDWILKDGIGGSSVADLDGLPWIQNPIRPPRPSPGRPPFRIELAPPLRGAVLE
ncbi:MAG: M1 family metallopeptidase, partial [Candidatus Eisenbacteria bacterium]|nr:M1 family metallopeptidase [Candidatus Eisenbacteria bacterium]